MKLHHLFPGLATLPFLLASSLAAEPSAGEPPTPKVQAALKTALRFLARNPESRRHYLPPDFSMDDAEKGIKIHYLSEEGERATRLNTVQNGLVDLGVSLGWKKDRDNMVELYEIVFGLLPEEFRSGLRSPEAVKQLPLRKTRKAVKRLLRHIDLNFTAITAILDPSDPGSTVDNPIGECDLEIGYEVAGDESEKSKRCAVGVYESAGLFINLDFPLKDNLTCIKDQGSRGTCVAHATAATIESLVLVDGDPAENLSEQHMYYRGETEGDAQISLASMQIEGLSTFTALDAFVQQSLGIFYESGWNYNQSLGNGDETVTAQGTVTYPASCDANYTGEACSDYCWQTATTVPLAGVPVPGPPPAVAGGPVHTIASHAYLPADEIGGVVTHSTLQTAILLLAGDVPLIVSMAVTDGFKNTLDGYVLYTSNDPVVGSHAMELIAFVDNADVPAGAPSATEEGYFIVKNSWGKDSGDCGFYYLDYGYVRRHLNGIYVIDIN